MFLRPYNGSVSDIEPQPTIPAPLESSAQYANNAAEASELAGFTVLTPGYLPAGYSVKAWSVDNRENSMYVVTSFADQDGCHFLLMNQTRFDDNAFFEQRYGEQETVSEVMVGDHAGVFISGRLMAHPDQPLLTNGEQPQLLPTNWLIWEAKGITYTLFGDGLEQSEMIQIAESLGS